MIHYLSCLSSKVVEEQMYGQFALGYFLPGQTLTVANTLRRGLLSQVPGISISCVYIHEAQHEYQTLVGVKECVLDILLRLKTIVIKGPEKIAPTVAYFNVTGPGVMRAKHLKLPYFLQCAQPETVIATLNEKAHLRIQCVIISGTGYLNLSQQPALYKKHRRVLQQGDPNKKCFPVDGVFSPVVKVNYTIETTSNNTEMAMMEVWTNGTLSPRDAIHRAVRGIIDLFLPWQSNTEITKNKSNPLTQKQLKPPTLAGRDDPLKSWEPWDPGRLPSSPGASAPAHAGAFAPANVLAGVKREADFKDEGLKLRRENHIQNKVEELYTLQQAAYKFHKIAIERTLGLGYLVEPELLPLDSVFDQLPNPNKRRLDMQKRFDFQNQVQDLVMRQVPVNEVEGWTPTMTPFNVSVFLGEHLYLRSHHVYQTPVERLVPKSMQDLTCHENTIKTPSIIDDYSRIAPEKLDVKFNMDINHIPFDSTIYKQLKKWNVNTVEQLRWLQPRDLFQMSLTFDQIESIRCQMTLFIYKDRL